MNKNSLGALPMFDRAHARRGRRMSRARGTIAALTSILALIASAGQAIAGAIQVADLRDLSLEQLGAIVVTSVSRREQALGAAAASIYVMSAEDIRRSGATSIPEALRLAPNLFVARADANQYAISARGFANTLANRMLVLIDGRIVYSPLFSGVFWEAQDVMLEDVERIEVISGPGATLWGANAVNGVINVITRPASATQGLLVAGNTGNREHGAAVRYGGALGGGGHYRGYAKYVDRNNTQRANGAGIPDESRRSQAGFRADWSAPDRVVTVQGDVYSSDIAQAIGGSRDLAGANLLARLTQQTAAGGTVQAQAYYDRVEREQPGAIREVLDIINVEAQHGFQITEANKLLWGATYRHAKEDLQNLAAAALAFLPESRDLTWYSFFAQHEWNVRSDVALTVGMKAEHNDYTGFEFLPSARLAWAPSPEQLVWTAVSRAVRAPSRIDRELFVPGTAPFVLAGGPNFVSEVSRVYELGYRAQATPRLSYSITAFHHDHQRLRSNEPVPGATFQNRISGSSKGIEAWASWRAADDWRFDAGWVELRQALTPDAGSSASAAGLGNDPHRWIKLRSAIDITPRHQLDVMARYVSGLPNPAVPSYTAVDARLGWRATKEVDLSLLLQNLFDRSHPEWGAAGTRAEYVRGLFFKVIWRPQ
jgi:iron complex outermembrane receptor protein